MSNQSFEVPWRGSDYLLYHRATSCFVLAVIETAALEQSNQKGFRVYRVLVCEVVKTYEGVHENYKKNSQLL